MIRLLVGRRLERLEDEGPRADDNRSYFYRSPHASIVKRKRHRGSDRGQTRVRRGSDRYSLLSEGTNGSRRTRRVARVAD